MKKRIYISADYAEEKGDREVIDVLHSWGKDSFHAMSFTDTAEVVSGSVTEDEDCRACDLKKEFNRQINISSVVLFIVGDKTAERCAGSFCQRLEKGANCPCTPYKQNSKGTKMCKWFSTSKAEGDDIGNINKYTYLEHEFRQARSKDKEIIIIYNSLKKQQGWLPDYMKNHQYIEIPFWKYDERGNKVGDYSNLKRLLGF
ncbi:hypothetical protein [Pseudobutyrivibrio sp.]|uniref:hypothetical protein n=1 Tax=Pseudobutyrivibrio sp. TaxID=2014367 RepID=UPI001D739603|nr:hypothetical protein [Pseudobutyrivibrio sp.]MBE5912272.1 hypothetical protein [Pseudobutyrivibrio sp.]